MFATVRHDGVEIQFSKLDGDGGSAPKAMRRTLGAGVYIWIDDADALYEELKARGAKIRKGPVRREYNCVEIDVEDCFGFRLIFGADCSPSAKLDILGTA